MRLAKAGKILLYGVAGFAVAVSLLLLGVKLMLDRAPHYQSEIKDWVFEQTGYHISFAHVSPSLRWYGPELYFTGLELRSRDDRRVLARANGGRIAVDIWQLLHSGRFLAGRVQLDSPDIVVTRLGPDRFAIAAEIGETGDVAQTTVRARDLPSGTLAVRHARFTLRDWSKDLPTLVLQDISIDLKHESDGIGAVFAGQLPPELGGSASAHARIQGDGELSTLAWEGLVTLRGISFPGWRRL